MCVVTSSGYKSDSLIAINLRYLLACRTLSGPKNGILTERPSTFAADLGSFDFRYLMVTGS